MHPWHFFSVIFFLLLGVSLPAAEPVTPDHAEKMARGQDLFRKQLRPLLLERCVKCHGGEKVRSGFDLTSRETLLKGGDNGTVIVPGKSKESRLWKLVSHLDDPHMPPKEGKLSAAQIGFLAAWID